MYLGGRRFSEGTSADREIQRTLMEVCSSQVVLYIHNAHNFYLNLDLHGSIAADILHERKSQRRKPYLLVYNKI